jgi:hypothetical protein
MSEGPAKRRWYQFTIQRIMWATFWAAVFSGSLVLFNRLWNHELVPLESETPAYLVLGALSFVSPPAAIGCLFGSWWIGAVVGLVLFCAYVAYILIAISIYPI